MLRTLRYLPVLILLLVFTGDLTDAQRRFPRKPKPPNQGQAGDWYNLGPIGGKAGLERSPGLGAKSGLSVKSVYQGAPGELAGLRPGDIIVGAPKSFGGNAYHELAKAIEAAETQKKAKKALVKLTVLRDGKQTRLEVKLPHYGADAKKFPAGKMRDKIIDQATAWLAKQQQSNGAWRCKLSAKNGRVVMTSLCGLALMASGSTAARGKYATNVKKAAASVAANVGKKSGLGASQGAGNWNQNNWGLGYGGIFLSEVQKASPQPGLKDKLIWIRDQILANQEKSGGWAHGPGGPNALNYLELEIVSNCCIAALGGIKANGIEVDDAKLQKALDYVQKCSRGGGVGYSTRRGQVGQGDVGRTGGAVVAFGACGRADHPYYKSMVGFMKANLRKIAGGHVSPTMHHLSAAAGCYREGKSTWAAYWKAQRQECTMLRNPDGTFDARPTSESQQMGRNTDQSLGLVWSTSHWIIILCLEKDRLPVLMGKSGKPAKKKPKKVVTGEKKEKKKKKKEKPDMDKILEE